jgi:hypothetical protein
MWRDGDAMVECSAEWGVRTRNVRIYSLHFHLGVLQLAAAFSMICTSVNDANAVHNQGESKLSHSTVAPPHKIRK